MSIALRVVAATIAVTSVSAEWKEGACPERGQNKPAETFDAFSMAGLWYEYVWDSSFAQGYDYKCSTWILLNNEAEEGPGSYLVYNNMLFPAANEGAEDENSFIKFKWSWDAPTEAG